MYGISCTLPWEHLSQTTIAPTNGTMTMICDLINQLCPITVAKLDHSPFSTLLHPPIPGDIPLTPGDVHLNFTRCTRPIIRGLDVPFSPNNP
ncbi:hypothetical protein JTE90_027368 [Oedothorax gibbosus]|uniref:Uncharacterized protein n=1 Tax=Oedothorax gibbosus TaxID=931172 RepID=A0AAV6VZ71_9ARAC|nr:hypothetical protein JTE90_027368 [Oedothorax gibbosus]